MCAMLSRTGLARKLSRRTLFTIKEADHLIEELAKVISEELCKGNDVNVVGFGKFFLYEHPQRPVRNPKTKQEMTLQPYKSVKFRPSEKLKEVLKEVHNGRDKIPAFEFPEDFEEDYEEESKE